MMAEIEVVDGQTLVVEKTYRNKEQIQIELDNLLIQEANMQHQLLIVQGQISKSQALIAEIESSL